MSMVRAGDLGVKDSPFHRFRCDGCYQPLGDHFQFRPDKLADVVGGVESRKADGVLYCRPDQTARAGAYHQTELRRTFAPDYMHARPGESGSIPQSARKTL